jgi:RNA polymerase sigma-70 factor (ECF subfamily)
MKGKFKMTLTWMESIRQAVEDTETDADAFLDAAFETHWSWVCRTLAYMVGDWDEAQDLALEVFYRLHTRPPRDRSKLGSWLHRVATNVGLNAIRARRRRQKYEETVGQWKLQQAAENPAAAVERRETQAQVRRVLATMSRRKAQLLILRYTGHSYAEIADILDVAPGSVGTMLARAEQAFERRYRALEDVS